MGSLELMVRVHVKAVVLPKLDGTHENALNNLMHIECRSVIDAIPFSDSPAILILRTLACNCVPASPSIFFAQRKRLRRSNLIDFHGRAWTTNIHQDRVPLFAHIVEAARTSAQDVRASQKMSDTQKFKQMKHNLKYQIQSLRS